MIGRSLLKTEPRNADHARRGQRARRYPGETLEAFMSRFDRNEPPLPFGMFVDLEEIVILTSDSRRSDGAAPGRPRRLARSCNSTTPEFAGKDTPRGSQHGSSAITSRPWSRHGFVISPTTGNRRLPRAQTYSTRQDCLERLAGGMTRSDARAAVTPLY